MKSGDIKSIELIDERSVHVHLINGQVKYVKENDLIIDSELVDLFVAADTYKHYLKAEVAMWKLKATLHSMGLLTSVDAALNNLPEQTKTTALLAWEYSPTVSSESIVAKFVQGVLSLTDEQVEQIFTVAETISLEDNQQQNRSHKSSVVLPVFGNDGKVKPESIILKTRPNWFKRLINLIKRMLRKKRIFKK